MFHINSQFLSSWSIPGCHGYKTIHQSSFLLILGLILTPSESLTNLLPVLMNDQFNVSVGNPCNGSLQLSTQQKFMCEEEPKTIHYVAAGIYLSLQECQIQFRTERWNCSTSSYANFSKLGTKESAFIHGVTSVGVAYKISRACSTGNLSICSCDNPGKRRKKREELRMEPQPTDWEWGGCSDNVNFGVKFSQKFTDAPEEELHESLIGARAMASLHNYKVGRKILSQMTSTKCRCHGASGACAIRTCWRVMPSFKTLGDKLKSLYDMSAIQVTKKRHKKLRPVDKTIKKRSIQSRHTLVYTERSPDFCSKHPELGILGVRDRECNRTGTGVDSCTALCCGRGYNTQLLEKTENCRCKFHWCCHVTCDKCTSIKEVFTCK